MKLSEKWLREWVNPPISLQELCHQLTMAGLEVDDSSPFKNTFCIDIAITPNRGDCLSVKGVARDVAAVTNSTLLSPIRIDSVTATAKETIKVTVDSPADCPRYMGRIIKEVKADTPAPAWLQETLECAGIRSINAIVDITNYVMLELGQPMHAFDLNKIDECIIVRQSKAGEKITLLDNSEQTLDNETLVIADHKKPLAIAGVMGGLDSGVTTLTKSIFLESAYFDSKTIARQRQHYQLNSDSAYRFERGVDFTIQRDAIERATTLILEIAGGQAGPVIECESKSHLPVMPVITLTKNKLDKILGISIDNQVVTDILSRLHFQPAFTDNKNPAWTITVPPFRFDMRQPEDMIEEIVRLYGYDKIPVHMPVGDLRSDDRASTDTDLSLLKQAFSHHGYHEILSYSFVDHRSQSLLDPDKLPLKLMNPISAEMGVMRTSLWPGLVNTLIYNASRQQSDIRLFETGTCFIPEKEGVLQVTRLGGLLSGRAQPEQWGVASRKADFYDLKGHLEEILTPWLGSSLTFKQGLHPALHPGQTALLYHEDTYIGLAGTLHPVVIQALDLSDKAVVFEIDAAYLKNRGKTLIEEVSKFPEIRRDIAILVNQTVPGDKIQATIKASAGDWLKDVFIFDVYQGKGISPGLKSIALALIWQHPTRTLVDEEVTGLMEQVTNTLKGKLGAELRS